MTCKDCAHYEVCLAWCRGVETDQTICKRFKDKTKFVEPNSKLFQYDSERIYELKVKKIIYDCGHIAFDKDSIGKTVFLTKEETEKALKEMESK